ncbi:MAG: M23 family metallopeptidase [Candidatus Binatia bacterium]
MNKSYSILLIPWRGTRVRRLVVSRRSIRLLACVAVTILSLSGWLLNNYFTMKLEREKDGILKTQLNETVTKLNFRLKEEVATLKANHNEGMTKLNFQVETQREKLLALQKRTRASQKLLANWKGLRKKIKDSLPRKRKSSLTGQQIVVQLETSLASVQGDLESLIASIPTEWPTKGWVSSRFGSRRSPWTGKREFHAGIDIAGRRGTPVYASGNGLVKFAGPSNGNGKSIVLNHGQGITTHYGHLSKIHVKKGERVQKNQKIANVGNTGKSTNPHLHYEVRINGIPIDPRRKLLKRKSPSS